MHSAYGLHPKSYRKENEKSSWDKPLKVQHFKDCFMSLLILFEKKQDKNSMWQLENEDNSSLRRCISEVVENYSLLKVMECARCWKHRREWWCSLSTKYLAASVKYSSCKADRNSFLSSNAWTRTYQTYLDMAKLTDFRLYVLF